MDNEHDAALVSKLSLVNGWLQDKLGHVPSFDINKESICALNTCVQFQHHCARAEQPEPFFSPDHDSPML